MSEPTGHWPLSGRLLRLQVIAQLRVFLRIPVALFFTVALPLIIVVLFNLVFGSAGATVETATGDWHLEQFCGRFHRHLVTDTEPQGWLQLRGELFHRMFQAPQQPPLLRHVIGQWRRAGRKSSQLGDAVATLAFPTHLVADNVRRDPEEPRLDVGSAFERLGGAGELEERRLHQIFEL
jgi:hypothetical protein